MTTPFSGIRSSLWKRNKEVKIQIYRRPIYVVGKWQVGKRFEKL